MRREDIDALLSTMQALSAEAQEIIAAALATATETADPAQIRDELITIMQAVVERYAAAAAVSAADWYEVLRALEANLPEYLVQLAPAISPAAVEAKVRAVAGPLWVEDGADQVSAALTGMVDRIVKAAGRDTITLAAENDPARPRFARIPSGTETCAFCRMLASRGFDYSSLKAAGADRKFHAHCDCMIVPSWSAKTPRIDGYDPSADYRRLQAARKAAAKAAGTLTLSDWDIVSQMEKLFPEIYPPHGNRDAQQDAEQSLKVSPTGGVQPG